MNGTSRSRLPDFVVIGAMKSGTSSLHEYLAAHPEISMSEAKELNFFHPERLERFGLDWYRAQFSAKPDALLAGESSPQYSMCHEFPRTSDLLHQFLPNVKMVYVVRDPIKRIESQWVHLVGSGDIRSSFSESVRDVESSLLVQTSRYWTQLTWHFRNFSPEAFKIVSSERLAQSPRQVTGDVVAFLGLEPVDDPVFDQRFHESSNKIRPNWIGRQLWGRPARRRRLAKSVPWLVGRPIPRPKWDADDLARVTEYLRPDVEALRAHTGDAFPEWSM